MANPRHILQIEEGNRLTTPNAYIYTSKSNGMSFFLLFTGSLSFLIHYTAAAQEHENVETAPWHDRQERTHPEKSQVLAILRQSIKRYVHNIIMVRPPYSFFARHQIYFALSSDAFEIVWIKKKNSSDFESLSDRMRVLCNTTCNTSYFCWSLYSDRL